MKSYKYKLKPSPKIVSLLERWLGFLCELYNAALKERIGAYRLAYKSIGYKQQADQLSDIKKERKRIGRIHSQVLRATCKVAYSIVKPSPP